MNRNTVRNTGTLEKAPVALYLNVTIGSTGAPTLNTPKCQGVYAMTRTGVGAYTIKLGLSATSLDTYQRLLNLIVATLKSTAPANFGVYIVADNSATATAPTVLIQLVDAAGAAVEASSGTVLLIKMELSNTTAV